MLRENFLMLIRRFRFLSRLFANFHTIKLTFQTKFWANYYSSQLRLTKKKIVGEITKQKEITKITVIKIIKANKNPVFKYSKETHERRI